MSQWNVISVPATNASYAFRGNLLLFHMLFFFTKYPDVNKNCLTSFIFLKTHLKFNPRVMTWWRQFNLTHVKTRIQFYTKFLFLKRTGKNCPPNLILNHDVFFFCFFVKFCCFDVLQFLSQETVDYVNKCWKFIYTNPSVRADIQVGEKSCH